MERESGHQKDDTDHDVLDDSEHYQCLGYYFVMFSYADMGLASLICAIEKIADEGVRSRLMTKLDAGAKVQRLKSVWNIPDQSNLGLRLKRFYKREYLFRNRLAHNWLRVPRDGRNHMIVASLHQMPFKDLGSTSAHKFAPVRIELAEMWIRGGWLYDFYQDLTGLLGSAVQGQQVDILNPLSMAPEELSKHISLNVAIFKN